MIIKKKQASLLIKIILLLGIIGGIYSFLRTKNVEWQTYNNSAISFEYPSEWIAGEVKVYGSSNEIIFEDPHGKFNLYYIERINYNQKTGKSYSSFIEYIKIPYLKPISHINDYEVYQVLPRAGSEHINSADFFSKDKPILSLELDTLNKREEDIKNGQVLFSHIINSFKFLKTHE